MHVEIGAEAALFPKKEYIKGIAVAVQGPGGNQSVHVTTLIFTNLRVGVRGWRGGRGRDIRALEIFSSFLKMTIC
jgi:hypothetical protein